MGRQVGKMLGEPWLTTSAVMSVLRGNGGFAGEER